MQALLAPLKELAEYDEIRKSVRQGKGTIALSGCVDSQKLHMIYGLSDGLKYKVIVTYNDLKAKEIYEEYRFYDRNVMLYPAKDLIFFQADIHGNLSMTSKPILCLVFSYSLPGFPSPAIIYIAFSLLSCIQCAILYFRIFAEKKQLPPASDFPGAVYWFLISKSNPGVYYMYLWTQYEGNCYPDQLLARIKVTDTDITVDPATSKSYFFKIPIVISIVIVLQSWPFYTKIVC